MKKVFIYSLFIAVAACGGSSQSSVSQAGADTSAAPGSGGLNADGITSIDCQFVNQGDSPVPVDSDSITCTVDLGDDQPSCSGGSSCTIQLSPDDAKVVTAEYGLPSVSTLPRSSGVTVKATATYGGVSDSGSVTTNVNLNDSNYQFGNTLYINLLWGLQSGNSL